MISCLMWNIYLYFIILKLFTNYQNIMFLVKIIANASLTDFSYFPPKFVFRKLLNTVRTDRKWPVWKGMLRISVIFHWFQLFYFLTTIIPGNRRLLVIFVFSLICYIWKTNGKRKMSSVGLRHQKKDGKHCTKRYIVYIHL
jgi:hypothetical protein